MNKQDYYSAGLLVVLSNDNSQPKKNQQQMSLGIN